MKFKIKPSESVVPQEKLVEMTLYMDCAGDVLIQANGHNIGWFDHDTGCFELAAPGTAHLLGFTEDEDGWLKIIR